MATKGSNKGMRPEKNGFRCRPAESKPRERIEKAGTASVASAAELLAVILKTGTAGCDVMELSRRVIDAAGGVGGLVRLDVGDLSAMVRDWNAGNPGRRISGLGRVKLLQLAAAFELVRRGYGDAADPHRPLTAPGEAARVFRAEMRLPASQESFWVLPLDVKMRQIVAPQRISVGTVDGVGVHPRDVFAAAVRWNAHSIIVAHNHPSGSATPSDRDAKLTSRLIVASSAMGIPLLDHLIVTERAHYSFAADRRDLWVGGAAKAASDNAVGGGVPPRKPV